MRDGTVEVQDLYYRKPDGTIRYERWIEGWCVDSSDDSPVVFIDWWNLKSVWTTLVKLPTALVKEGPKAMVVYVNNTH
jgi:hypothetical protein